MKGNIEITYNVETFKQNLIYIIFYESFLVYYTLLHFKETRCLFN